MTLWIHTATVVTRMGNFEDMLRYDSCYPDDSDSVVEMGMANSPSGRRERKEEAEEESKETGKRVKPKPFRINIAKRSDTKTDGFTVGRWESFGCKLEDIKVRKA